jgi:hypothetical protein
LTRGLAVLVDVAAELERGFFFAMKFAFADYCFVNAYCWSFSLESQPEA